MARHAKGGYRTGFSALLAPLLVAVGLVTVPIAAPPAQAAACPAGLITPVHSSTLYWDKKGNDNATGAYLGYKITNTTGSSMTSVSVVTNLGTTGNDAVKRGGGQPSTETIGSIANGAAATAYFLVDVKQGAGTQSVTTTLNYNSTNCTLPETLTTPSRRALAANANKIFSAKVVASSGGTVGTVPAIITQGSFATVVVTGNTGTIGSGPGANREVNLTPVVYPTRFAADAWKLVDVTFRSANSSCGASGIISNRIHISNATSPSSTNCGGLYSAAFTFQSRDADESSVSEVQAFSYIASGNLIKHTSPFGSTIGLPTVNNSTGTATTAATIDLAQELSAAISSGAVGFTAEELSMVVYQGQSQTAGEPTFVSGTGPVTNICLVNPNDSSICSDGPFTVKNLKEDESSGTTDAGVFEIVQVGGQDRVRFTASASYYIGGSNSTDQPARIVMRLTDSTSPTAQTSDSFANAAVVQGSPPTATGATSSGNLNTAQTMSVAATGTSLTKCVFTSLPIPEPCADTTVSANGSWVLNGSANTVTYTPTNNFIGSTTIYFGVTDAQGAVAYAALDATVIGSPTATSQPATSVGNSAATINGSITTGGLSTDVKFCWGTSSVLTSCTEVTPAASPLSHSGSAQSVSQALSGLNPATTYYFRVSANNTQGGWINGSILNFTTTSTPPAVTTTGASNVAATSATLGGSITAGSLNATPSFILSTSNAVNGSGALTQNVGTGAGAGSAINAGATSAITESWSGLTSGVTYYFQAVGTPTSGAAVYGQVQSFTAGASAAAPSATTSAASQIENTTATLNASVNPNNGATSIHFCWGTSSSLTGCTKTAATPTSASGASSVSASLALSGLTADTEYFFQVIANNGVGGDGSNDVFGTIESFRTSAPPVSITNAPAAITGESATFRGRINPKGNSTTAEFCFRKASTPGETPNSSTFCASGTSTAQVAGAVTGNEQDVTVAVADLEPNSEYVYQLKGTSNKGNSLGSIQRFNTSAVPPIPVTQAAANITQNSAVISGTVNPRNKGATIKFCWGTASDLTGCTKVNGGTASGNGNSPVSSTLSLSSLMPGTTYYYRIIGNNGVGGFNSSSVSFSAMGATFSFDPDLYSPSGASFGALAAETNDVDGSILNFTTQSVLAATTLAATNTTDTTATINGSVNPGGETTSVSFCFGTDSSLGTCLSSPVPSNSPLSGSASVAVSAPVTGLTAGTTYYFRVSATNSGQGTQTGSILSFTTSATPPAPTPSVIEESDPCEPEVEISSATYVELGLAGVVLDLIGMTQELTHSAAMATYHRAMESDLVVAFALNQSALVNPAGQAQSYQETMAKAADFFAFAKSTPKTLTQEDEILPTEVVVGPGSEPNSVSVSTSTGEPLELLSVQSIDLNLYAAFTGAELNNPAVWQGIGYGMQCWKLEPFVDTWFYLPASAQPPGAPPGNWVFSNVIVKAGSITADPTTFQANTLFPAPKGGEMVWADVNGNGVYDPGGKGGDKAISHIVLCANLISASSPSPSSSPSPTGTPTVAPTTAPAPTPSASPEQTVTPTPTATTSPTATPSPTSTPTVTPSPTLTPAPIPSPEPTTAACSDPEVAPPSPAPTPTILIRILGTPEPTPSSSPTPTTSPTASPSPTLTPAPTASPEPTVTPTPTASPTASPSPSVTPEPTASPSPTTSPSPTASPSPAPTATPAPLPGPSERPEGPVPTPVFDPAPPTSCQPSPEFGVAMKLTNGLSTTCFRMTSASFLSIASFGGFEPISDSEDSSATGELADTGFELSHWLVVAMLMLAAGSALLVYARRRA